jgi:hypothetical protein
MKNIEARFRIFYKEPASTYLAFARAIKEQGLSGESISRNFTKLVEKNDYDKNDRKQILENLYRLNSGAYEHEKKGKNRF